MTEMLSTRFTQAQSSRINGSYTCFPGLFRTCKDGIPGFPGLKNKACKLPSEVRRGAPENLESGAT